MGAQLKQVEELKLLNSNSKIEDWQYGTMLMLSSDTNEYPHESFCSVKDAMSL
jgi:hypothetical protein